MIMTKENVSRRDFMLETMARCGTGAVLAGALSAHASTTETQKEPSRPNLVFVFSDQHSWDMLGCYGNKDVQSPHLDKFARESILFNHCISNSPVCTPYRSILFSGLHPLYNGGMRNDIQMVPGHGNYFGEVLRDAGYFTGYFGKWHLYGGDRVRPVPPGPLRYGFDDVFLTNNCTLLYDADRAYYWDEEGNRQLYGDWEPYAQTRQAMEFLDNHGDNPFALFLSWHPPHDWGQEHYGYHAPEDCLSLYDPEALTLRPNVFDTLPNRMRYQGHMAMITSIDRAFGWLMDKLDELNLSENTIVVFTSDHGDMLMSYQWPANKGRPEHLSCRVPFLMRWPEHLKPGANDTLFGTFEIMPTLLGLMGLPVPETCQGIDCSDALLKGEDAGIEAQHLFFMPQNWRGVYTRRHTYSYSLRQEDRNEVFSANVLYDRQEDPWETRNLFGISSLDTQQDELHSMTLESMKRFGDEGLDLNAILRKTLREEDWQYIGVAPRDRPAGWEHRLKGPPINYLQDD